LTVAIIVLLALVVLLLGLLAFVMSRPKELRPHRPNRRRIAWWRARTRGGRPPTAEPPPGP
jgi:hypothetical protein